MLVEVLALLAPRWPLFYLWQEKLQLQVIFPILWFNTSSSQCHSILTIHEQWIKFSCQNGTFLRPDWSLAYSIVSSSAEPYDATRCNFTEVIRMQNCQLSLHDLHKTGKSWNIFLTKNMNIFDQNEGVCIFCSQRCQIHHCQSNFLTVRVRNWLTLPMINQTLRAIYSLRRIHSNKINNMKEQFRKSQKQKINRLKSWTNWLNRAWELIRSWLFPVFCRDISWSPSDV